MSKLDVVESMRLVSLLRTRFMALYKTGLIYQRDYEAVALKLETPSMELAFDSLDRFALPTSRCRFWEMDVNSSSILALDGCQETIQKSLDILQDLHPKTCVVLGSSEEDQSKDAADLLSIAMGAMEQENPIIISLTATSPSLLDRLQHLGQLLGYDYHVIQFLTNASIDPDVLSNVARDDSSSIDRLWTVSAASSEEAVMEMLLKIIDGSRNHEETEEAGQWDYLCVFLSARSATNLRRIVPMKYEHVSGDRLPLIPRPSAHLLGELPPLGSPVRMTVIDIISDDDVQCAMVQLDKTVRRHSSIVKPHRILLSCRDPISLLDSEWTSTGTCEDIPEQLEIEGTLGLLISRGPNRPPQKVICRDHLQEENSLHDAFLTVSDVDWVPINESQDITFLHVFDFDGTLMNSPGEFIGKREYQDVLGIPYPHLGWYGRNESLLPPVRVLPGPALHDCRFHYGRAGSWTVVLTGRIKRVRLGVEAILRRYHVDYDELICKAGYSDTQTFKIKTIMTLLGKSRNVKEIKIWEDNVENLSEMYDLKKSLAGRVELEIVEAPAMSPPRSMKMGFFSWEERRYQKGIASFLEAVGALPSREYWLHAEMGIEILVETWKRVLGVDCFLKDLFFVLGLHGFGIRQNIDLRLLAPEGLSPDDCMTQLGKLLTEIGIDWSKDGTLIRARLRFRGCCPIDYRLGFVRINNTAIGKALSSAVDLTAHLIPKDIDSQMAVDMWKTMEKVEKIGETRMAREMIKTALAMSDQILRIHEEKTDRPYNNTAAYLINRMAVFLDQYGNLNDVSSDTFCINFVQFMVRLMPILKHPIDSEDGETMCEAPVETWEIQILMAAISSQLPTKSDDLYWTKIHDILVANLSAGNP